MGLRVLFWECDICAKQNEVLWDSAGMFRGDKKNGIYSKLEDDDLPDGWIVRRIKDDTFSVHALRLPPEAWSYFANKDYLTICSKSCFEAARTIVENHRIDIGNRIIEDLKKLRKHEEIYSR